jgi:hypothetical protein
MPDESLKVRSKMRMRVRPFLVPMIILVTVIALSLFPIADCFDCEGPNPWGRDDVAYQLRSEVFEAWLILASFLVGIFRIRFGWTVPLAIAIADCLTQPLGGVELRSLINNEGPVALIMDTLIGLVSFGVGRLLSEFVIRRNQSTARILPPGSRS